MRAGFIHNFVLVYTFLIFLAANFFYPSTVTAATPTIAGCPVLPSDNIWNTPIDSLPVSPNSATYINTIGATTGLHPDFGSGLYEGAPIGIPLTIVSGTQTKVPVTFDYEDESDPGPYPIPPDALIEGGPDAEGDRHVLILDKDSCILYETFYSFPQSNGSWQAGSGAVYDLRSNALRHRGWTSADAAGLPIFPGLVRYDEIASGEINHAIRFTAPQTRREYVWPARHYASSLTGTAYPPMGQRFRLKAGYDISGFSPQLQVLLQALKKYGLILADNGSRWYISGVPDPRWDNDMFVSELRRVKGSDFEAVDGTALMVDPESGRASGDFTPPELTLNPPITPTNLTSQTIGGIMEEGATVNVTTDTSASDGPATGNGSDWSYTISGLAAGPNGITVTAADGAGNTTVRTATVIRNPVLMVNFSGDGGGAVAGNPGIACGTDCSENIEYGATAVLSAQPLPYSLFTGWSGACSGTGNCSIFMNSDQNVTAIFDFDTARKTRIGDTSNYFPTLQAAYDASASGGTVKAWGTGFTENLNAFQGKEVSVIGGYNDGYTGVIGTTTLTGVLTVERGCLAVENLVIR